MQTHLSMIVRLTSTTTAHNAQILEVVNYFGMRVVQVSKRLEVLMSRKPSITLKNRRRPGNRISEKVLYPKGRNIRCRSFYQSSRYPRPHATRALHPLI